MAKQRTVYICQSCGAEAARWSGQCPACDEWNVMVETLPAAPRKAGPVASVSPSSAAIALHSVASDAGRRLTTNMPEFDRVLGGGLVPGAVVLIGGDPGVGKSTLVLQASCLMARQNLSILYITGEEAPHQVRDRAVRLGFEKSSVQLLPETDIDTVLASIQAAAPALAIVDSIQSVATTDLNSAPGSIGQVRECASRLARQAKETDVPLLMVGHVTKEGAVAGPRALEHLVDAVVYLEGDRFSSFRVLRAAKNRFGSTNEVGVFQMGEAGLTEVGNPSAFFLAERSKQAIGSVVVATMEGSRPLLMEIQALTTRNSYGNPRRTASGVDYGRLHIVLAVLSKIGGLELGAQDVYVNVVGGLQVEEPAADLGIAVAMASSLSGVPIAGDAVMIGEVGLSGEVRSVGQIERRIGEAAQLGFSKVLVPARQADAGTRETGIEVIGVRTIKQVLAWQRSGN